VVTSRADVHYVITEYGVAYLHGKPLRERAMQLISIAHPDFRDRLLEEAKELGYIPRDQLPLTPAVRYYPEQYERLETFKGGIKVFMRPIKPTDEPLEREFFYTLSDEAIYFRFFSYLKALPHEKLQRVVNLDYHDEMAIAGFVGPPENEEMVAIGRFNREPGTNIAEVAFLVRDDHQNLGIGTWLLRYLIQIAQEKGLAGFKADVLAPNKKMMNVFSKSGYRLVTQMVEDTYVLKIDFSVAVPVTER
jgi:GNAT superfamily N-acetyltransferase